MTHKLREKASSLLKSAQHAVRRALSETLSLVNRQLDAVTKRPSLIFVHCIAVFSSITLIVKVSESVGLIAPIGIALLCVVIYLFLLSKDPHLGLEKPYEGSLPPYIVEFPARKEEVDEIIKHCQNQFGSAGIDPRLDREYYERDKLSIIVLKDDKSSICGFMDFYAVKRDFMCELSADGGTILRALERCVLSHPFARRTDNVYIGTLMLMRRSEGLARGRQVAMLLWAWAHLFKRIHEFNGGDVTLYAMPLSQDGRQLLDDLNFEKDLHMDHQRCFMYSRRVKPYDIDVLIKKYGPACNRACQIIWRTDENHGLDDYAEQQKKVG